MVEDRTSGGRRAALEAVNLGLNFAVAMALCGWGGHWLDNRNGGDGVFWTTCGLFLGLTYGFYEVWKLSRELGRAERGARDQDEDGRSDKT